MGWRPTCWTRARGRWSAPSARRRSSSARRSVRRCLRRWYAKGCRWARRCGRRDGSSWSGIATRWGCCTRYTAAPICASAGPPIAASRSDRGSTMTDSAQAISQLQAEIAAPQQAITMLAALPEAQNRLQAQLAQKQQQLAQPQATNPTSLGALPAERDINIATNQTITNLSTIIYGPDPDAIQREQLTRYLQRLAAKLQRLPLRGLAAQLDDGPGIALPYVYMMLATTSHVELASDAAASTTPVEYF